MIAGDQKTGDKDMKFEYIWKIPVVLVAIVHGNV
jgi:hypothetical protein